MLTAPDNLKSYWMVVSHTKSSGSNTVNMMRTSSKNEPAQVAGELLPGCCLKIVILGLSITSSWGNGHATTYRGLVKELAARGHRVLFLERDQQWYAANRDLPKPPYSRVALYTTLKQLKDRFTTAVRNADLVVVGSYVPEGIAIGEWVLRTAQGATAFYDIDTPVTMSGLARGDVDYVSPAQIARYNVYLSFTGGPILDFIENEYGSPMARPLY